MNAEQFKDLLVSMGGDPWSKISTFLPNLVGAALILGLGYLISKVVQRLGSAVLHRLGFDSLTARIGINRFMEQGGVDLSPSVLIGRLLFWLLMLTFILSAAETLGLSNVSKTIEALVLYLPNVIAAVVILVIGVALASFVRGLIQGGASTLGVDYAQALGRIAYGGLVIVAATLAIGQLQVETTLLNRIILVLLVGAAATVAFALGTGTREIAKNLIAGVYLRDLYRPGARLSVGEHTGSLEEIGPIVTKLRTSADTCVNIPNARLTDAVVQVESNKD